MWLCTVVEDVDWGMWDSYNEKEPKRIRCTKHTALTVYGETQMTAPIIFNCIVGKRYKLWVSYEESDHPASLNKGYAEGSKLMYCGRPQDKPKGKK